MFVCLFVLKRTEATSQRTTTRQKREGPSCFRPHQQGFAETDALSICSAEAREQPVSATQEGGFVAGKWCASATVG